MSAVSVSAVLPDGKRLAGNNRDDAVSSPRR